MDGHPNNNPSGFVCSLRQWRSRPQSVRSAVGSRLLPASALIYCVVLLCVYLLPLRDSGVSAEMINQKAYVTYDHC